MPGCDRLRWVGACILPHPLPPFRGILWKRRYGMPGLRCGVGVPPWVKFTLPPPPFSVCFVENAVRNWQRVRRRGCARRFRRLRARWQRSGCGGDLGPGSWRGPARFQPSRKARRESRTTLSAPLLIVRGVSSAGCALRRFRATDPAPASQDGAPAHPRLCQCSPVRWASRQGCPKDSRRANRAVCDSSTGSTRRLGAPSVWGRLLDMVDHDAIHRRFC